MSKLKFYDEGKCETKYDVIRKEIQIFLCVFLSQILVL